MLLKKALLNFSQKILLKNLEMWSIITDIFNLIQKDLHLSNKASEMMHAFVFISELGIG